MTDFDAPLRKPFEPPIYTKVEKRAPEKRGEYLTELPEPALVSSDAAHVIEWMRATLKGEGREYNNLAVMAALAEIVYDCTSATSVAMLRQGRVKRAAIEDGEKLRRRP